MSETETTTPSGDVLQNLVKEIGGLTLLQATALVKEMETTFGVDASISAGVAVQPSAVDVTETKKEEKTTFDVIVEAVASDKRVPVLKVIRKLTSLGLADAKAFTISLPKALKEEVSKEEAEEAKVALEEAGAKVVIS